jgi:hypothetical protein
MQNIPVCRRTWDAEDEIIDIIGFNQS